MHLKNIIWDLESKSRAVYRDLIKHGQNRGSKEIRGGVQIRKEILSS